MRTIERLLLENKAWIQDKLMRNPAFLEHVKDDRPCDVFWIGCSDSRLHAEAITNSEPGEILVHRNIGNQVVLTDLNLLGALEYAINVFNIKHIIVCGHYDCQGVKAAMDSTNCHLPNLDQWLANIRAILAKHRSELELETTEKAQWDRLCELNVIEQAHHLSNTEQILNLRAAGLKTFIHGWIYGLHDGVIKELVSITPNS